jgi:hypothetical protein
LPPEFFVSQVGQDGILRADWQSALAWHEAGFRPPVTFPRHISPRI